MTSQRAIGSMVAGASGLLLLGAQAAIARRRAGEPIARPGGYSVEFGDVGLPPLRIAVVGDSTALGVGAGTRSLSYPWVLAERVAGRFHVSLTVIGRVGARVVDTENFAAAVSILAPDVALVGIGANDVTHGTSLRLVERQMSRALKKITDAAGATIVAVGSRMTPPILPPPLRQIADIRAALVNNAVARAAARWGASLVDLRAELGNIPSKMSMYWSPDGYHPSSWGYRLWAEAILPKLERSCELMLRDEINHLAKPLPR